jgi:exopolysaccharide biosynthesis polyprenyl glycosylphosphotransferase
MEAVTFKQAETGELMGLPDSNAVGIKHSHLHLLDERKSAADADHWRHRRFVATKPINDADHVEPLASVRRSMRREQIYRRALAIADGSTALLVTLATAALWGAEFRWAFLLVPVGAVLVSKVQGLYDRDDMVVRKSTVGEWRNVLRANVITGMAAYLIWWASTVPSEGRGLRMFAFLVTGMFLLSLPMRGVARRLARALASDERCLIVGATDRCAALAKVLRETPGLYLIGAVSDDDVDCSVAGVHELVEQLNVERVVVVPHTGWGERGSLKLVQSSKWLGVRVSLLPTVMAVVGAAGTMDQLDSMVLLGVPRFGLSRSSETLKRAFDLVGASLGLLFATPLFIVIALAIKRDSNGTVLFRQRRVGRNGTAFTMYKFRTMVDGAERMKAQLGSNNETSGLFKMADDPRVTKAGKFLRRTHLDELPQLVNVLRGEMSLVGPRPLIESEDCLLQGYDRHRARLLPGMTGPWQLRGPIDAPLPELAKLDYMYASHWSIWTDVDILIGTAARVIQRAGR